MIRATQQLSDSFFNIYNVIYNKYRVDGVSDTLIRGTYSNIIYSNVLQRLRFSYSMSKSLLGSLLGIFLIIQFIRGILPSIHYCPNVSLAFQKMIHIIQNVNNG